METDELKAGYGAWVNKIRTEGYLIRENLRRERMVHFVLDDDPELIQRLRHKIGAGFDEREWLSRGVLSPSEAQGRV